LKGFFLYGTVKLCALLKTNCVTKKNYADIINLYFLILNKKTLYFDQSNKIINYEFEIFNLWDLRMTFRDLRFRDLGI